MDCPMINSSDWTALTLTFELALISTIILLVIGTPISLVAFSDKSTI